MPTTAYAVRVTPPVEDGFYNPVTVAFPAKNTVGRRFTWETDPAVAANPAYTTLDGSTVVTPAVIDEPTVFYFVAATPVDLEVTTPSGKADRQSVTPAAYATPTDVLLAPATTGGDAVAKAFNAQTGTSYTLTAADVDKIVTLTNAGAIALSVPQDSAAAIPVGAPPTVLIALGAGQVTVQAGSGATLRVAGLTAKSRAQYSRLMVQKIAANTWQVWGDVAAS